MGNCLIIQSKIVQVMKMDGKVLEYRTPLKVQQVLSEYTDHAISDMLPVHCHLGPETDMLGGHMYYLLPPIPSKEINNIKEEPEKGTGIVRIKIIVTKQQLKAMLAKGVVSVDDMVSQLQNKQKSIDTKSSSRNCGVWKPVLQSIPE